jgi:hypothetical protein
LQIGEAAKFASLDGNLTKVDEFFSCVASHVSFREQLGHFPCSFVTFVDTLLLVSACLLDAGSIFQLPTQMDSRGSIRCVLLDYVQYSCSSAVLDIYTVAYRIGNAWPTYDCS